jgi:hypothetical protein
MDKRKPAGRSAAELGRIFAELPDATFCFDIGHARQFDPTMTEAWLILKEFGSKLRQVHVSEVNTRSKGDYVLVKCIVAEANTTACLTPRFWLSRKLRI